MTCEMQFRFVKHTFQLRALKVCARATLFRIRLKLPAGIGASWGCAAYERAVNVGGAVPVLAMCR